MKVKGLFVFAGLVLAGVNLDAQVLDPGAESPLDGVYSKSVDTPHKVPVAYVQLREADIMWLQRVWREVDMREKPNHSFLFPTDPTQGRKNLMQVVRDGLEMERIHAYSAQDSATLFPDDTFKRQVTFTEVVESMSTTSTVAGDEDEYGEVEYSEQKEYIPWNTITRFRIKEEVFFDKQRSSMETRILGIAPMKPNKNEDGEIEGYTEAFWIYFPEARFIFAEAEVYNVHNDAVRMTYEELFWKRKFASRIIKVSNVFDRGISDYKTPLDALLEAEKLEEEIFNREHDIWSF
jgi:gliding motility associated protien GldN